MWHGLYSAPKFKYPIQVVWWKTSTAPDPKNTILTVKHGDVRIMLWACFSEAATVMLISPDGKMDDINTVQKVKMLQAAKDLKLVLLLV